MAERLQGKDGRRAEEYVKRQTDESPSIARGGGVGWQSIRGCKDHMIGRLGVGADRRDLVGRVRWQPCSTAVVTMGGKARQRPTGSAWRLAVDDGAPQRQPTGTLQVRGALPAVRRQAVSGRLTTSQARFVARHPFLDSTEIQVPGPAPLLIHPSSRSGASEVASMICEMGTLSLFLRLSRLTNLRPLCILTLALRYPHSKVY